MNSNEIELSVIIPAYNAEQTIGRCLSSIYAESIDPSLFEIIVIDDGSTDRTFDFVKGYAKDHTNLFLLSENNSGPSAARNFGLKSARGRYVTFVDSDDYLIGGTFKKALLFPKKDDGLILMMKKETNGKLADSFIDPSLVRLASSSEPVLTLLAKTDKFIGSSCNIFFSRAILLSHSLVFTEGMYCEDILFNLSYFSYVTSMHSLDDLYYVYVTQAGSRVSPQHAKNIVQSLLKIFDTFRQSALALTPFGKLAASMIDYEAPIALAYSYFLPHKARRNAQHLLKPYLSFCHKSFRKSSRIVWFCSRFGCLFCSFLLHFRIVRKTKVK
jgi:glycosyltransferase involved in cell wall biosynthesis